MKDKRYIQWILTTLVLCVSTLLLLLPAIWNGYPHVYSDTGAYLATAFEGTVPLSRPTGYGLFIRFTAFGGNLWWTIIVQALIFVALIQRVVSLLFPKQTTWTIMAVVIAMAALTTGTQWYVGQLMPDVFAGPLSLTFFLLLFDQRHPWIAKPILLLLAFVFGISHYSYMALLLAMTGAFMLFLVYRKLRKQPYIFRPINLLLPFLAGVATVLFFYSVNYANGYGWRMTRSSHVFTMAKLSESGLLKLYLEESCAEKNWSLCQFKDSLPATAAEFIWNDPSPFKSTGYWDNSQVEYEAMLSDFYSRPKFLGLYFKDSFKCAFWQLFELAVAEGLTPYNESSSPYIFFERAKPDEIPAFLASKQFDKLYNFEWESLLLKLVTAFSALLLFILLIMRRREISDLVYNLALACILAYVFNAAITGALANVYSRLQARIAWLLPCAVVLILFELWLNRKKAS